MSLPCVRHPRNGRKPLWENAHPYTADFATLNGASVVLGRRDIEALHYSSALGSYSISLKVSKVQLPDLLP